MTPELQTQVSIWRQKLLAGNLTKEEMIDAVKVLREGRRSAAMASTTAAKARATKAATPAVNGNDLLDEMCNG